MNTEKENKVYDAIRMVNPSKKSLDDLTFMRIDYLRKGYNTEIRGESISRNLDIITLYIYDK